MPLEEATYCKTTSDEATPKIKLNSVYLLILEELLSALVNNTACRTYKLLPDWLWCGNGEKSIFSTLNQVEFGTEEKLNF